MRQQNSGTLVRTELWNAMNRSRLSVISEGAQVVSALAVVVSLVYVGYEIRQNTDATRAATRQAVAETDLIYIGGLLDPALVASAEAKRRTGAALSDEEQLVLYTRQHLNFRIFENAHYQFEMGLLEPEVWDRRLEIASGQLRNNPYAAEMWEDLSWSFTGSFRSVVDSISRTMPEP